MLFMEGLGERIREGHHFQLTTDGFNGYPPAVEWVFNGDVDYAVVVKDFGEERSEKHIIAGEPEWRHMSTSLIERHNLTIRMENRQLTRLTNAFSKKPDNHFYAQAIFFLYYNFARPHISQHGRTPAQAAGLSDHRWRVEELVELLVRKEAAA